MSFCVFVYRMNKLQPSVTPINSPVVQQPMSPGYLDPNVITGSQVAAFAQSTSVRSLIHYLIFWTAALTIMEVGDLENK